MVQSDSVRERRSVPPQRGRAPHPNRALFKEREKNLPKLPPNECTWAGPDAKNYHPHILEAAPKFTYHGRRLWSPYTRKATLIDYTKTINDNHLEYVCERKLHHGHMRHSEHGK